MIEVKPLTTYSPEVADRVRALLIQLSRSGKDRGEIPAAWFERIIASPDHDLLLAYELPDESAASQTSNSSQASNSPQTSAAPRILGMASLSLVLGPGIRANAYLEDFVTDASVRGKGVGRALWAAMLDWARAHDAARLEFTCGQGREAAQAFYEHHGATKYPTNFYRCEL